jgi:DNA adenine methylase
MTVQEAFGLRLKQLRELYTLSQQQLAEKAGIGREQISKIESGQVNVTIETINRLSSALGISVKDLVTFSKDSEPLPTGGDLVLDTHPIVKWAGGKSQILAKILALFPVSYGHYYEPFVGGGALFFAVQPREATINDFNEELVDVYRCFQDDDLYSNLLSKLQEHEHNHSEEYFMKIRSMDKDANFKSLPLYERAARMIYLNKACFNGLYRVNAKGFFNVPSAKKDHVITYDRANLPAIHAFFKRSSITILNGDFSEAVKSAQKGDLVYFDPPYDTYKDDGFVSYTKDSFGRDEQRRLAGVYAELTNRGVNCILSNHNTPLINELYKPYNIHVITAKRMINSDPNGRGDVEEVLVTNFKND